MIESGLYVEALLAPLPERERAVMRLVSNGVGPTEIAAVLGLHTATVGRLRVQAVVRLRRSMREEGAAEGREYLARGGCPAKSTDPARAAIRYTLYVLARRA